MPAKPKTSLLKSSHRPSMRAKVFQSGGSRALRLPKEFRPETDEVLITRVEEGLLVSPLPAVLSAAEWWNDWKADAEFMADGRQQPALQNRDFSR